MATSFITATGSVHVIRREHLELMKNGAILVNAGNFANEIDVPALTQLAAFEMHDQALSRRVAAEDPDRASSDEYDLVAAGQDRGRERVDCFALGQLPDRFRLIAFGLKWGDELVRHG